METIQDVLNDIRKPLFPMLVLNWIFGVGIIEYPLGKKHRIVSFFYATFNILMYCWLIVNSRSSISLFPQNFQTDMLDYGIFFWAHVFLTIGSIILGWRRSDNLHCAIVQIAIADNLTEILGVPRDYTKLFFIQIGKIGVVVLIIIILITMSIFTLSSNGDAKGMVLGTIVLNYPAILILLVDVIFLNLTGHVNSKLSQLNNLLRNLINGVNHEPLHTKILFNHLNKIYTENHSANHINHDKTFVIKTAKTVHLRFVKSCRMIDHAFGLHILLSLIVTTIIMTVELYYIYYSLLINSDEIKGLYRFIGCYTTWLVYYFTTIYMLSFSCSCLAAESIKTGDIISELYDDPSISTAAQDEIRDFQIQLVHNTIKFEVHGFITLDFSLLQTFITSVTTNLMILIQLGSDTLL